MRLYTVLNKQVFQKGDYRLIPIRFEDRHSIMKWRNEQIYHFSKRTKCSLIKGTRLNLENLTD